MNPVKGDMSAGEVSKESLVVLSTLPKLAAPRFPTLQDEHN